MIILIFRNLMMRFIKLFELIKMIFIYILFTSINLIIHLLLCQYILIFNYKLYEI